VLQQAQRERDIVPLTLGLAPSQTGSELLGELFGMFVLEPNVSSSVVWQGSKNMANDQLTFSTNPNKNLTILLNASSSIL
jgi:hypothetical protein